MISLRRSSLVLTLALAAGLPAHAQAVDLQGSAALSPAEQLAIATAFAPVLVYHPQEEYFPIGSLFPLPLDETSVAPDADGRSVSGALASVADRVAQYRALPRDVRLSSASVGYRVFSRVDRGETEVVVEYWCHYVYNQYSVRIGWLPYRVRDNHEEDLERVYVVLSRADTRESPADTTLAEVRRMFRVKRVVANAHDGSIPPNQYEVRPGASLTLPLSILVERGSHAMASDINHDGRFTPAIDSTATGKLLWGIRDGGKAWGWYRASYMDARDETAVRLCATREDDENRSCAPYALYPVDDLQRWFDGLQLSERDRLEIVGRTSWVSRMFGDVRIEDLTVPTDPADGRVLDLMMSRRTRSQDGFVLGFATVAHAPALTLGRQFFWNVPSRRMPDLMADAIALFPNGQRAGIHGTVAGAYSLDAGTNVLAGVGWFSTSRTHADVLAGVDVRIGRFHVRPTRRFRDGGYQATMVALF